jgi:ABC-type branched-subunit amino acid transport system ATPase component/ABC-type branched-subunit amino acid transport system permease subunit
MSTVSTGADTKASRSTTNKNIRLRPPAWRDAVRVALVALVAVVLGLAAGDNGFWIRLVTSAAILYILVGSYNIIFGYAGLFNLAHVAIYGVGAYASVILEARLGWSFWLSLVAASLIALVVSMVVAIPTSRLGGAFFALGTLAFSVAVHEVTVEWNSLTGGVMGYLGIVPVTIGDQVFYGGTIEYYWLVAPMAVIAFEFFYRFGRSPVARRLVALRESVVATQAVGIDPWRQRMLAFAVSGTIAGFAGALVAHQLMYISPESFGLHIMINVLIVMLIGGAGTQLGPVIGVIALVVIQEAGEQVGDASNLLFGLAIVAIFAFAPGGLVGVGKGLARRAPEPLRSRLLNKRTPPTVDVVLPDPHASEGQHQLVVRDVDLSFAGVRALNGVGFSIGSGEVLGLIGPNGAGKTSVVNVASGLVRPQGGTVELDGEELVGLAPHAIARKGLVRTFQSARVIPEFDLATNVMLGRSGSARATLGEQMLDLPRSRRDDEESYVAALGLLELVGVREHAHDIAGDLPYGVLRRAEIARALMLEPLFLLLDEPGAGLSNFERDEIAAAIHAAAGQGVGCLLIDHNIQFVASVCPRLMVYANGTVLAEGPSAEVLAHADVIHAYLGGAGV